MKSVRYYINLRSDTKDKLDALFKKYAQPYGFQVRAFSQLFEEALPRLEDALIKNSRHLESRIPNAATLAAMEESRNMKTARFATPEELFNALEKKEKTVAEQIHAEKK